MFELGGILPVYTGHGRQTSVLSEVTLLIFHPLADAVTVGLGKGLVGEQGQVALPSLSFRRRLRVATFRRLKVKTGPGLSEVRDGWGRGRT